MDRGPIQAALTPATELFLRAAERADWARALEVLDEHWAEVWFAVDPTDLRTLLSEAPDLEVASRAGARFVARAAGHGAVDDLLEPLPAPGRDATPGDLARYVADLRLGGRPAAALAQVRRSHGLVRAQRGQLLDGTGGTVSLWLVQAGLTALLAGEPASARGYFLEACDAHRPDRFPFVVREATAKLALTLAVTGDVTEAVQVSERARALPRTGSWVETIVDDTIWLTDYICAADALDPRAEELRVARPSPMSLGELWPFALHAQVRHLALTGRDGSARTLCDTVAAAVPPAAGCDGLLATTVEDARAVIGGQGRPHGHGEGTPRTASSLVAEAARLFAAGQFPAVLRVEPPPPGDERSRRALALLHGQAAAALGRAAEGRELVLRTVEEILDRGTWATLRLLTRPTLESLAGTPAGDRARSLVQEAGLPSLEVRAVLVAPLSAAEIDALRLLREGLTREEIAARLFLSVNTVKTQLRSAYRKLGAGSRPQALETFARLDL